MEKFCIHCGKKLKEGQTCSCQNDVKVVEPKLNSELGNSLLAIAKGMFIKPIDTIKKNGKEKNFNLALATVGIYALVAALFTLSLIKNAYSLVSDSIGTSYYSLTSSVSVDIPYAKIFFTCLIVAIIFAFIYAGILYLVNSIIFKGESTFKKTFTVYGINTIIESASLLVAAIVMYVHVGLGIAVVLLGSILNIVYVYKSIEFLGVKDENKHGYIYLITMVFYIIAALIIGSIFS